MRIENNSGEQITSVDAWGVLGKPASGDHWREYRSAYELAYAWIEGDARERLRSLVAKSVPGVAFERAVAERKTHFDAIRSGPRNHDLLVIGTCDSGRLVVGVEGKADETFDADLVSWRANRVRNRPDSRAPQRLDGLTRAFFGTTLAEDPSLSTLRYQLLSALAGTLADARGEDAAVAALVIHEFDTPETSAVKQQLNAQDLARFVQRLGGTPPTDGDWLAGPFTVPGNDYLPGDVPFYVGKLHTRVERRGGVAAVKPVPAS